MEKLLLEINRYKQLMNIVLLTESGKVVDAFMPISARSIDNLTKQGVDFANDLSKLSDEFTNRGIKTFDGLTRAVAVKNGLNPNMNLSYLNITDDMIKSYIKNDEKLYNSILAKAASAAAAEADILVKNADVTALFRSDPVQLVNVQRLLGANPSVRTIDALILGVDDSIVSIEKTIDEINMGNVPGVRTVPKDLDELYEQLLAKKLDLENYKNKDVTPEPVKFPKSSTKIEEDRVQISLGRNMENHFGKVQNIIISVDGEDITSENNVPDLGQMNIVINDGEIYVGNIVIPEKYREQGIATIVYQKISDHFGLPVVNSKTKGRNQLDQGGYIWKNRENFKPRNTQ
jgi:hypothetical protein